MKIQTFNSREEWFQARLGRITGTRLKDLISKRGTKPKMGYYELIAERIALPASDESAMDRGIRLEDEAMARFMQETGKKVNTDLVIWSRDDNDDMAISPDGFIGKTEAVECKCLSSANHIKAWLTKEIPDDYEYQVIQYFVVNDKLKKLYFVFYDPRMPKDFFWLEIKRKDVQEKVAECIEIERQVLEEIKKIENEFTFTN